MTLCISTRKDNIMTEPNDYLNFRAAEEEDHDAVIDVEVYGEEEW